MQCSPTPKNGLEKQPSLLWKTLFAGLTGYLGLFSSVPGEKKPNGTGTLGSLAGAYFRYPGQIPDALLWVRRNAEKGREIHLCPHLLTARRRLKRNAAAVKALWADADTAELPDGFPEPTITVRSSPGKHHLYWALRQPIEPEEADRISQRLTHTIGADPGGWALAALFRLPGTVNRKYPEGTRVEITSHDPFLIYHPREIDQYLTDPPQLLDLGNVPDPGSPEASLTIHELGALSQKMRDLILLGNKAAGRPYETKSHADFAVVIAMLGAGFEEEAIWQVFRDPSNGISEKYFARGDYGDYYLNRTIRRARERVEPAFAKRPGNPGKSPQIYRPNRRHKKSQAQRERNDR